MSLQARTLAQPTEVITPSDLVGRRRALGLTQRALGQMLGVPRNTIARWERGDLRIARPEWLALSLAKIEARARRLADGEISTGLPAASAPWCVPAELSRFVGREEDLEECCELLKQERLLTLVGAGGIGKSRLATQVARCVAGDFPQGVYLVDLSALEDPKLVPRAVSTVLGIAERSGDTIADLLIETLRRRRLLLVLDDCDRLIAACGALAYRLLRGAPNLTILATSREPLGVDGEFVYRVQPLSTPDEDAGFDEISSSAATRLFVLRAQAAAPWFKLTPSTAPGVARICRRLDGMPLAIELAAARLKALTLDQLAVRLEHGFQLLEGGSRTAPSRQQTLRATIDWSYRLLSERERVLFRRLSVFAGGFCVEPAERVTEVDPLAAGDTLPLLERLIDRSLVVSQERHGILRQSMLDTIREYARERMADAGEEEMIRRRHFDWVLAEVESIDPDKLTPSLIAVHMLEVENLRLALAWSIEAGETELGLRLATTTARVWSYSGHYVEGISWLQRMLALPGADELAYLRGKALKSIGSLSYGLGNMAAARDSIEAGCEMIIGCDTRDETPPSCSQLRANVARASGDLVGALRLYQQALDEYVELGLTFWVEVTLFFMGSAYFELGDYTSSSEACERCLALGDRRKFTWATSRARIIVAYLSNHDGDADKAVGMAEAALAELRALEDPPGVGIALRALSQFALDKGHLYSAWPHLAEALEIASVAGDRMALARTSETIACLLATDWPTEAAQLAGAAHALRTCTGTVPWPSEQARLDRWLQVARRKIGQRAFQAEWSAGAAVSDAETVAMARRFVSEVRGAKRKDTVERAPETACPLTPRQREVAGLVARGLTNEQIGQELVVSPATARAHVEHVLDRLDLHSRAQLAAWAATHKKTSDCK